MASLKQHDVPHLRRPMLAAPQAAHHLLSRGASKNMQKHFIRTGDRQAAVYRLVRLAETGVHIGPRRPCFSRGKLHNKVYLLSCAGGSPDRANLKVATLHYAGELPHAFVTLTFTPLSFWENHGDWSSHLNPVEINLKTRVQVTKLYQLAQLIGVD
jgi:hypothetical protein